jgi:hypothetical protein
MALWLYPISATSGRYFEDDRGRRVRVSYESFRDFVYTGKIRDERWYVYFNFDRIQEGDDLLIYTGDEDRGIVAHGIITTKDTETRSVIFRFDKGHTKQLLADPVPAQLVRQYIPFPRGSVISCQILQKLLPWQKEYRAKSQTILSKLKLKPVSHTFANFKGGQQRRLLQHDAILGPVKTYLKANGFMVGSRSFGQLHVDLGAIRKTELVIVEAKIINKGKGRQEAREGLGQLFEYSWLFRHENLGDVIKYYLWLAFSAPPDPTITEFLDSCNVLVSWVSTRGLRFSKKASFVATHRR